MGFSADFIDHLTATKTNKHDKLLQQIEQWNADDEEQKIIDAILKVPEANYWQRRSFYREPVKLPQPSRTH